MISQFTNTYQPLYNRNIISFDHTQMYIFGIKISISHTLCIEKHFIAEYIMKCLILLNRVHIVIEKYTAGCQQTFCWWQPVVTRHFVSDNRLSPDILLVTTGCQQTKKSGDNRLSADLVFYFYQSHQIFAMLKNLKSFSTESNCNLPLISLNRHIKRWKIVGVLPTVFPPLIHVLNSSLIGSSSCLALILTTSLSLSHLQM